MSLLKKLFKDGKGEPGKSEPPDSNTATQFHHSGDDEENASRVAPRRELLRVVLRDTMRQHGIPSDWIDHRVLAVTTRGGREGMHMTLIVRGGQEQLLAYVPAFQGSFKAGVQRFDPRAHDWLLSLSWQFDGLAAAPMPPPGAWTPAAAQPGLPKGLAPAAPGAATPSAPAALPPLDMPGLSPTAAAPAPAPTPAPEQDDVEQDLRALFAIRDAVLRDDDPPGFEPTQPPER